MYSGLGKFSPIDSKALISFMRHSTPDDKASASVFRRQQSFGA